MSHPLSLPLSGVRVMRALIADQDELNGKRLAQILSADKRISLEKKNVTASEALNAITTEAPDLVFISCHMTGAAWQDLAKRCAQLDIPFVLMSRDEHEAIAAFTAGALDYLLTPISAARLEKTLDRAYQRSQHVWFGTELNVPGSATEQKSTPYLEMVKARHADRIDIIDVRRISWFEAANQYVRVHADGKTHIISSESLNSLEGKLDPSLFFRVHRSAIVNCKYAKSLRCLSGNRQLLELTDGAVIKVSRYRKPTIEKLFISSQNK